MKLTQNYNQLEIKTSGVGQIITGAIFALIGIATVIFVAIRLSTGMNTVSSMLLFGIIGIVFIAIGSFSIFSAQSRHMTIQKNGASIIRSSRMIGGKTIQQDFDTTSVKAVRLATYLSRSSVNTSGGGRCSTLSLVMNNSDSIEIASRGNSSVNINGINVSSLIHKVPLSREAEQIADFLNVSVETIDMTNPLSAITSVVNDYKKHSNDQINNDSNR